MRTVTTNTIQGNTVALLNTAVNAFLLTIPAQNIVNIQFTSLGTAGAQRHQAMIIFYLY